MAACSTPGAFVQALNSDVRMTRCAILGTQDGISFCHRKTYCGMKGIQVRQDPVKFAGSNRKYCRFSKPLIRACESAATDLSKDSSEEKKLGSSAVKFMPNSSEVQSLVANICDTTSIAEFKLDFGGFHLYVKRGLEETVSALPMPPLAPSPPPVQKEISNQNAALNGSPATTSLAVLDPKVSSTGIQKFLDAAPDEGLVILQSPKVGLFRRSRTIKGKRAPPSCQERQEVKEGQVLCYIEQLGGEIPIESDVSGEVIKIVREDGEPVGYGDALIAVLPSFPGIKKLQR